MDGMTAGTCATNMTQKTKKWKNGQILELSLK